MMVRPELISASRAPSASPLKSCETRLGQLIMRQSLLWRAMVRVQKRVTPQDRSAVRGVTGVSEVSAVVAEMAAEGVRLLNQAFPRDDLDDVVPVFLVLHVLLLLALDDDHRPDALMVLGTVMHFAHQGGDRLALLVGLDHVGRAEAAGLLAHVRPMREADIG